MIEKIETCVGRIVRCSDGEYRRIIRVEPFHLIYEVPETSSKWKQIWPTSRRYVESLFLDGEIVEKAPFMP